MASLNHWYFTEFLEQNQEAARALREDYVQGVCKFFHRASHLTTVQLWNKMIAAQAKFWVNRLDDPIIASENDVQSTKQQAIKIWLNEFNEEEVKREIEKMFSS